MVSLKASLKKARVYLILDTQVNGYDELFEILKQSLNTGVDIVQLRDKFAKAIETLKFAKKAVRLINGRIPFIVNDRVDLALASQAAGVHLGQDDLPISEARKLMGKKAIIGVSCQNLIQAQEAKKQCADYIGFGSVFKTETKPDSQPMDLKLLKDAVSQIRIPIFAIGGIDLNNFLKIKALGINKIAVCRAICQADRVGKATKQFKEITGR